MLFQLLKFLYDSQNCYIKNFKKIFEFQILCLSFKMLFESEN